MFAWFHKSKEKEEYYLVKYVPKTDVTDYELSLLIDYLINRLPFPPPSEIICPKQWYDNMPQEIKRHFELVGDYDPKKRRK